MVGPGDILDALAQPLRAVLDPSERVFWGFVAASLVMPLVVLGARRGALALRHGLLSRAVWSSGSSRADVTLLFVKALWEAALRIPWLAATTGAALAVGLWLHDTLGPAPALSWSRPTIAAVYTVVLFVGWDASRFALHWLMHRVPALWAFHQVHHSATALTPLTLYRTHPLETMLFDLRGLVTTAAITGAFLWLFPGRAHAWTLLGVGGLGFVANLLGANLRHSHVWLRFGRLERVFISPAQHQLHHARHVAPSTCNLGTWLALWDRLAGTWRAAPRQAPTQYGVDDANHRPDSVGSMLVGPLVEVSRMLRRRWALAPWVGLALWLAMARAGAAEPEATAVESESESESEPEPEPESESEPEPESEPESESESESEPEPESESEDDSSGVRKIRVGSMFEAEELPRIAGSAHSISEQELERHEYDDMHRIVGTTPGVVVRGEDGFGLRPNIGMRGANPDRSAKITLLEDGILLGPAPYSAPAAYYFPLTTRMVGVEIFKGPASIRHGPNTIGGAINLRTREIPDEHKAVVDLAGGRFAYGKAHGYYGTRYKGFGVLIEAARVQTRGFKELDGGGDTGFGKNDTMLKLGYRSPAGQRTRHDVELKAGFATEDSNETYLGLSRGDFGASPYRRYAASGLDNMSWWRTQAELSYTLQQGDDVEFVARAYRHDFDRVWRRLDAFRGGPGLTEVLANPQAGQAAVYFGILRGEQDSLLPQQTLLVTNNDRRFFSQGVQNAFRWTPRWRFVSQELEVGARVHHDRITRRHTEDAFVMTSGVMVPEGSASAPTVRNRGETVAAAFHLVDAVTLWDRLTIAPGVRVEVISMRFLDGLTDESSRRFDTAVTPGVGAHVLATPWLGVFAGVHRGFSPVAPGQLEEVRPEFSLNYEAGTRARWRGLSAEAVGFVSDYGNLIGACTFSAGCTDGDGREQFNAGSVLIYGLESLLRWRNRFDSGFVLEAGGRYTYTASRFRSSFESTFPQWGDVEAGDALPYLPRHVVGGSFAVGGRMWEVSASPAYNSVMRDVAGQGAIPDAERVDGFFILDLAAEVRVLRRFRLYALLNNATNANYVASLRPFGARPGAPLTFIAGVKSHILP